MKNVRNIALIARQPDDILECVRTAAGLAVENLTVGVFLIDAPVDTDASSTDFKTHLEMIEDLEGSVFSNLSSNTERFDSIRFLAFDETGPSLRQYDLIITF